MYLQGNYNSQQLGPIVQMATNANQGLNVNLHFFFFCSKAFSRNSSLFYLEHTRNKL